MTFPILAQASPNPSRVAFTKLKCAGCFGQIKKPGCSQGCKQGFASTAPPTVVTMVKKKRSSTTNREKLKTEMPQFKREEYQNGVMKENSQNNVTIQIVLVTILGLGLVFAMLIFVYRLTGHKNRVAFTDTTMDPTIPQGFA